MKTWRRTAVLMVWLSSQTEAMSQAKPAEDEGAQSNLQNAPLDELRLAIQRQQQMIEAQQKRLEALEKRFDLAHPNLEQQAASDAKPKVENHVRSDHTVKLYGLVRADLEADTRRMSFDSQLPFFVLSPADPSQAVKSTGEFTVHPRLTRFGLDVNEYKVGRGWSATAKLEADFFNAFIDRPAPANPALPAGPNNPPSAHDLVNNSRAAVRVRHAYVRLQRDDWHILLGQTWDAISPIFPSLNADTVMWNAGNTADRRPQLRLGYEPARGKYQWSLVGMVGASGAVDGQDLDGDGFRDGEGGISPTVQARLGYSGPSHVKGQTWSVGVYGHRSYQEVNRFFVARKVSFSGHLVGTDLSLALTGRVGVKGEIWTGRNLSDVRGGVGQGIDLPTGRAIRAHGGWVEASYRVNRHYQFHLGAALDRPNRADLSLDNARTLNRTYYITNRFSFGHGLTVGFDYANWLTKFKALPAGKNNRFTLFIQNDF